VKLRMTRCDAVQLAEIFQIRQQPMPPPTRRRNRQLRQAM
jgi:hypothetical protein